VSVSVASVQPPVWERRRLFPAFAAIVVVVAMLALYALRPVTAPASSASPSTGGFASGYAAAVADFRASTAALQARGQAVSGGGTDEILPIYVALRDGTKSAADRFAALKAPSSAKADFATFTNLLREQVTALDSVVSDAGSGSARRLAADLQRYASLVSDWLAIRPKVEAALH
jgi:hypothetical protein